MTDTAVAEAPEAAPLRRGQVWLVIVGLLLGMLLAALDQTIVATALPTIVADLKGGSHLSWVVTAYLLASTASTPVWGKLGDQYGRKVFFQAAIVIFLAGSVLSGLSQNMLELIAFRAVQGLGGGGLIVGAQASIGDVVSPRERGRYQGIFGAVFGVTSVIGPLLGGFLAERSWRLIFYVNVPVAVVALVVTAAVLPGGRGRTRHQIDYLGTGVLALAATGLILLTSLGGTSFPWVSTPIVVMGAVSLVLLGVWVVVERRAAEPVIPLRLFRNRTFSSTGAVGFVVGFAMFGAVTFLPLYMQVVKGVSPTASGLRLVPLMIGLLATSVGAGQLISRWGRYKVFPVTGCAVMAAGLWMLSRLGAGSSATYSTLAMLVLGLGLGMVMQVLVIAVQNAVDYRDLGTGTSGATFFRSIGASFGVAVFGAILSNVLGGNLRRDLPRNIPVPANLSSAGASLTPAQLARLPAPIHRGIVLAYAASLQRVFLVAVPVAVVAFLLTWLIPELPLRRTAQAADPADTLAPTAIPNTRSSGDEIARALSVLARRENRAQIYRWLAERAQLDVPPAGTWLLLRFDQHPGWTFDQLADRLHVARADLLRQAEVLEAAGLVAVDGGRGAAVGYRLTAEGADAIVRLGQARTDGLNELLAGWSPEHHADVSRMVARLAADLLTDESAQDLAEAPAAD